MTQRTEKAASFFTKEENASITHAVAQAELQTSAEIRVVITGKFKNEPLEDAQRWFAKLEMEKTRDRNGILLILGVASHKFAILGDEA